MCFQAIQALGCISLILALTACSSTERRNVNRMSVYDHPPVITKMKDEVTANFVVVISNQSAAISEWPFFLKLESGTEFSEVIALGEVLTGFHDSASLPYQLENGSYTLIIACRTGQDDFGTKTVRFDMIGEKMVVYISTYCFFENGKISAGDPQIRVELLDELPAIF